MAYNYGSHKIIQYSNVKKFFSKIKKKKNIIQCHGVFDLVHPGHIRHFVHCRSKADTLIVSLTPDKFIKKGNYRPFIPQNMRASNLAALEMVDFVIIDENKLPYKLLNLVKPNYFAKGMEYFIQKNPLTEREKKIVEKNGGKMIFSPGDFVMSSTKIINDTKLDLRYEKLKALMDVEKINFKDLKKILKTLDKAKVHVIGDTIIDTNHHCEAIGGLHKTPTLSIAKKRSQDYLGGAAIVAAHFKSITKNVSLTTVFGNDEKGKFAKKEINKLKIKLNQIIEPDRITTNKNSYIVDKHKLLKVDEVNNSSILNSTINNISNIIKKEKDKIIVCSDFRHGIFNKQTVSVFLKSINKNCFKVADSQVASRWGNITDFNNFDLITPTEREARYSLFEQDLPIRTLSDSLLKSSKAKNIILKLGSRGLISLNQKRNDYVVLDPFVNNLIDSNGAGDALLAYAAATLYITNSLIISSIIGLLAASCKCERDGNNPVKREDIEKKIDEIEQILN